MSASDVVRPVHAATVILVRESDDGLECFMVRRHIRSDFAADVFVFPGGKIEPEDHVLTETMNLAGSPEEDNLALRVGALRELFEEAGVLLASREGRDIRFDGAEASRFEEHRASLLGHRFTFSDILSREGLVLATDRIVPFSHWITPEGSPRRYDTWFYLAQMPPAQTPLHDAQETVDSLWIRPQDGLDRYAAGSFPLVFATEKQLERLARFTSVKELAAGITPADLRPVMPRVVREGDAISFILPGEPGYDDPSVA